MNTKHKKEEQLVLELLDAVGRQSDISQRHLASHMGVALGLANSYLKRCIHKGWIKIRQVPANRYLYYLTPNGFAEKSRLTAKYLAYSLEFYRRAGASCLQLYAECKAEGQSRVIFGGCSDLAEIAVLRAQEVEIEALGVLDPGAKSQRLAGRPVWKSVDALPAFDICVLTDLVDPVKSHARLCEQLGPERVRVPDILRMVPSRPLDSAWQGKSGLSGRDLSSGRTVT